MGALWKDWGFAGLVVSRRGLHFTRHEFPFYKNWVADVGQATLVVIAIGIAIAVVIIVRLPVSDDRKTNAARKRAEKAAKKAAKKVAKELERAAQEQAALRARQQMLAAEEARIKREQVCGNCG